jgi:hypothetical protein
VLLLSLVLLQVPPLRVPSLLLLPLVQCIQELLRWDLDHLLQ